MPDPVQDVEALLRGAARELADHGVPSPRVDAEILLARVCGVPRGEVRRLALLGSVVPDDGATPGVADRFAQLVRRRAAREPLQHLTGRAPFRHVELDVGPGVFVPRPETEQVAEVAIEAAAGLVADRGSAVVVDLCTGSGAIALAVAAEVPGAVVHAVELDAAAHGWAVRNLRDTAVHLVRGDARRALGELDGSVDVVVSNPPYVPAQAVPQDPEVARHDPAVALYGLGEDGLEVPRGVATAAARLLRPGGLLVMEHAEVQAEAARRLVAERGLVGAATLPDLTGRPRMVVARRPGAVGSPRTVTDWTA